MCEVDQSWWLFILVLNVNPPLLHVCRGWAVFKTISHPLSITSFIGILIYQRGGMHAYTRTRIHTENVHPQVRIHTHPHPHVHTHAHTHSDVHTCTTYIGRHTDTHMCICIHLHTETHMHTQMRTHTGIYTHTGCTRPHTAIHTHCQSFNFHYLGLVRHQIILGLCNGHHLGGNWYVSGLASGILYPFTNLYPFLLPLFFLLLFFSTFCVLFIFFLSYSYT